jgi:hypothetical protein
MALRAARRSTRCKSGRCKFWRAIGSDVVSLALISTLAMVPVILVPSAAFAKVDRQLLAAFAGDPVVSTSELDKQRGGFFLPNGGLVNFGLEIQQFVDNTLQNALTVNQVANHFTVTTGGTTTDLTQLPANGFTATTVTNNGATKLVTTILNGAIHTLAQNTANSQTIQTVTTLNIATQGFQSALHNVTTTAQILNTIQMNSWIHH